MKLRSGADPTWVQRESVELEEGSITLLISTDVKDPSHNIKGRQNTFL